MFWQKENCLVPSILEPLEPNIRHKHEIISELQFREGQEGPTKPTFLTIMEMQT